MRRRLIIKCSECLAVIFESRSEAFSKAAKVSFGVCDKCRPEAKPKRKYIPNMEVLPHFLKQKKG